MPLLLHLNGPPGVGKSTIAARLIPRRALALNLDIDDLRVRLGQWEETPESKQVARALGFGIAAEHLRNGHDVVLPQLVAAPEVLDQLHELASEAGAEFVEVVLIAPRDELVTRLRASYGLRPHPRDAFTLDDLERRVGNTLELIAELAPALPSAHLLDVSGLSIEEATDRVRHASGWG